MGVMEKSFRKGVKYLLNLEPLPNTTFYGSRYLHNHVLLNIWINLADDFSMYSIFTFNTSSRLKQGTLTISNHPVKGSIILMQVRFTSFLMIAPPELCCILNLAYRPIRLICTNFYGFNAGIILGGRCP